MEYTIRSIDRQSPYNANIYRDDHRPSNFPWASDTVKAIPLADMPDGFSYIGCRFDERMQPITEPRPNTWAWILPISDLTDADLRKISLVEIHQVLVNGDSALA